MDFKDLDKIVQEEVNRVLAQRELEQQIMLPPSHTETIDANACRGPVCGFTALSESSSNPQKQTRQPKPFPKPQGPAILCLMSGAKERWDVLSQAFSEWHSKGIHVDAVFSSSGRDVIDSRELQSLGIRPVENPKEIYEIMYDLKRYNAVFLPSMSRNSAAKLALGITDNISLNVTIAALAQHVPTFASDEGLLPTACIVCGNNVPGIQEILANYRNHLGHMGLKIASAENVVKQITNLVLHITEGGMDLISTLITEYEAEQMSGPVIKVSRGGLITPSALDVFQRKGIEVVIVPKAN